jgi:4-aminobutyrate aminotransferase-like enzyme
MRIAPPLSTTQSEMDEGLAIFEEAITLAERELKKN